jgi:hypothetical protein
LDIAAPLHGKPKDELDCEDMRQRTAVKRLAIGTLATLLTMVAGAGLWAFLEQKVATSRERAVISYEVGRLPHRDDAPVDIAHFTADGTRVLTATRHGDVHLLESRGAPSTHQCGLRAASLSGDVKLRKFS